MCVALLAKACGLGLLSIGHVRISGHSAFRAVPRHGCVAVPNRDADRVTAVAAQPRPQRAQGGRKMSTMSMNNLARISQMHASLIRSVGRVCV
jgi:hypothetical protein